MSGIEALTVAARVQVVNAVVTRHNLRSTVRLTGVPQNRVKALIMKLGAACARFQDETLEGLPGGNLEWSETLAFQAKVGNAPEEQEYRRTTGSVWTWTCLDSRSKLVPSWRIGPKNSSAEAELHRDIAQRYEKREPIGSIALSVGDSSIDFPGREHVRYICRKWFGTLQGGFARKVERHSAVVALCLMYYNFSLIHPDFGTTPAIASGKATHIWRADDIVALLDRTVPHSTTGM